MKNISKYLYILVLFACIGIGGLVYKNNERIRGRVNTLNFGDTASINLPGIPAKVVLSGNIGIPIQQTDLLNLLSGTNYILSFDYYTTGPDNNFNVDLYPDSLPQKQFTAKQTKQHANWEFSSKDSAMANCRIRFFDDIQEANEKDIVIENITLSLSSNNSNYVSDLPATITLSGKLDLPIKQSNVISLTTTDTYIISFDYYTTGVDNKFNVDLYPDSLPQKQFTAKKTKQHAEWSVSSKNVDMTNCRLRFFDDIREDNEGDIIIQNVSLVKKVAPVDDSKVQLDFPEQVVLKGSASLPVVQSQPLNLLTKTQYIISFDYKTASGTNKFNVDLYPDTLPEVHLTATTTTQHYEWKVMSDSNDMKNCRLRFFDNQKNDSNQDITITNIKMVKSKANTYTVTYYGVSTIITGLESGVTLSGSVAIPEKKSNNLSLSANTKYLLSFDYKTTSGTNKFNVDFFPDSLPEKHLTATTTTQHIEWEVSSNSSDMNKCQLRFFDNQQEANEKDIVISNVKLMNISGDLRITKKITKTEGDKLGTLQTATKTGYKFFGWYTDKTVGTKVSSDTVVTKNMNLYPRWQAPAVTSISLDKTTISLVKGNSQKLKVNVKPADAEVKSTTWSSNNSKIATVDKNGTVKGVGAGTATITVTVNGNKTATCKVTVSNPVVLTKIDVSPTKAAISRNETKKLNITFTPSNATNKTITWVSDKPKVASVDKNGVVKGIGAGTAKITATSSNGLKAVSTITVSATLLAEKITLDKNNITLTKGQKNKLTATISPKDTTNKKITWSSDKKNVATVDKNGNITAVSIGTATITAKTSNGLKAVCKVTVSSPKGSTEVVLGGTSFTTLGNYQYETIDFDSVLEKAKLGSFKGNTTIDWKSSNDDYLTVLYRTPYGGRAYYQISYYPKGADKTVTLKGYSGKEVVAELTIKIVRGTYTIEFAQTNVKKQYKFGDKLGSTPTKTKDGHMIGGWHYILNENWKMNADSVVTRDMVLAPEIIEIIPETYKVPSGYSEIANRSYSSSTLKYKTIKSDKQEKYYSLIWVENAYEQINSANNNLNGATRGGILENELNKNPGYKNKGMIAINGSFKANNRSNTPVIVTKGNYVVNDRYEKADRFYYGTLTVGKDNMLKTYTTRNVSELTNWLNSVGARNTWAITHFETSNWNGGGTEEGWKSSICQVDSNNFVLYVGTNVGIFEYIKEMHNLFGCKTVVNLDGGGSSGMYAKLGNSNRFETIKQHVSPQDKTPRQVADMLYFVEK